MSAVYDGGGTGGQCIGSIMFATRNLWGVLHACVGMSWVTIGVAFNNVAVCQEFKVYLKHI